MLKAVIFNTDGVITDLSYFNFLAWKSIFSFQGINLTKKKWLKHINKSRLDTAHSILKEHHKFSNHEQVKEIANKKNELFIHLIKNKLTFKNIYSGIPTLIDKCKTNGLQLLVASNSTNVTLEINCLGLSKKMNKVLFLSNSTDAQLLKLLSKYNLKPDECIWIEDKPDNIKQYKRLGIFTIGIAHFNDEVKKVSDYWSELPEQINFDEIVFAYYKQDRPEI